MKSVWMMMGLLLLLAACTTSPATPNQDMMNGDMMENDMIGETKEFEILAYNWGFDPAVVTVNKGDRVKMTFIGRDASHGVALPDFGVGTAPFTPGETQTLEFVANKAGTFSYYCNVYCGQGHSGMMGQIEVKG